jgi:hypothetical protein
MRRGSARRSSPRSRAWSAIQSPEAIRKILDCMGVTEFGAGDGNDIDLHLSVSTSVIPVATRGHRCVSVSHEFQDSTLKRLLFFLYAKVSHSS